MPKKFIKCTRKLLKKGYGSKAYPICRKSTGFYGSTHHIGMLHPIKHKKAKLILTGDKVKLQRMKLHLEKEHPSTRHHLKLRF